MDNKIDLVVGGYLIHNDKVLLIHHKKLNLWLPVGGHIDLNETPDQALKREFKEETNLDIEIIGNFSIPLVGNTKENLALPFHTNVHNVGDHDHCCFYYLCETTDPSQLITNNELKGAEWFTKDDLEQKRVPEDVKHIALEAFRKLTISSN